jgi:hypothetical protein
MKNKKKQRNKKYKQSYKSERQDYRQGGRVQKAKGGVNTRSVEPDDVLDKINKPNRPIAEPIRKPIAQKPQKPIQPGIPVTGGGDLGSGKMPRADLPTGPAKAPVNTARPIQRGGVGGIKQIDSSSNQIIPNVSAATSQTGQPAQPSLRKQREIELQNMAGKTINVGPEGLKSNRPRNAQDAVEQSSQTLLRRPTTGKGSDQMSIGGIGGGNTPQPQPNQEESWWKNAGFNSAAEAKAAGWTYEGEIGEWVPPGGGTPAGGGTTTDDNTTTTTTTEPTAEELAAQEKTRQQELARDTAEAAARGEVSEAAQIPDAVKIEEGTPQQVTTMAPVTAARTDIQAEGQAPEQVSTVDKTVIAPTPDAITTEEMPVTTVDEEVQVETAEGVVSDEALAKAAEVDRVAPIEGADVDIPEGALAERVVGTISEGAKATAAMNAGTSLSRITRAKKQLSRAGLSDEDIAEIGNDPEALEDRLADFSEEQRGIIEGLPQEALVSTQMNGLLEGIENGEIPTWARPAVAQVEQMLARRGMSASTVGRDSLFNSIIQSAMPIAQSNAQAIQQSVSQQKTIEAQTAEANAQRVQQTALTNAQNVFNMDMAQFNSDQQIALSNSKFLQTVGLTEANNDQQGIIQDAMLMSQANLTEADFYQKNQIQNAQAFLQMDMQNLANEQQANVLKAQQTQQRMLSNQSAQNAAAQFNAASENQTQQFMSNLNAQVNQYNASQTNAVAQFNSTQENAASARDAGRAADVEKFNTQLETQVDQFNANQDFARNQWNSQNQAVVEQSNTQWRRNLNTANTAMQNQINAQNAQNSFAMSQTAQSFLWQELRDQADYDFRNGENEKNRIAQLVNTALASDPSKYGGSISSIEQLIGAITGDLFSS